MSLAGTGVAPIIPVTLSPLSVSFPGQYVGTSGLPQSVMLTNNESTVLTISNVTASPSDFAPLSTCGNSVNPGASCSIGVFFDPTADGTRTGTLTITDSAPGSPQTVALAGTGEDFSFSASSPSQTISPGQTASYSLTPSPDSGFNQTVQLSCAGAPAQSSCSVSPSSTTLNGSASQPVTITVTTAGTSAGLTVPAGLPPSRTTYGLWLPLSGVLGLATLMLPVGSRRLRRRGMLCGLILLCLLAMLMMPACGGSSGSSSGNGGGTPAGTYNLTVTGNFTSGSTTLTRTTKLTLVVQ